MNAPTFRSTAFLVAHAYTDPTGRMSPQIQAVRIYSEGATSLSYVGKNTTALDAYHVSARSYQVASDNLCYLVQTLDSFAWCRPLMDPRHMEPIDFLYVEVRREDAESIDVIKVILRKKLSQLAEDDLDKMLAPATRGTPIVLVRGSMVDEINSHLREYHRSTARVWFKRDYDRWVADQEANERAKSEDYHATLGALTQVTFGNDNSENATVRPPVDTKSE